METESLKRVPWAAATNIYEVNTRQYTPEGTFKAFAGELTRLKDMGVETLWFMPIQPVGQKNRKGALGSYYSISDYKSINPEFGTLDDFKVLVNSAHSLGFKVIIDWVANHTSWDHVWTESHPHFFSRDSKGEFRPPFDWDDVIHLNYDNKELWDEMISDMKYWIKEAGIDGFRCDMAHLVPLDFWKHARKELDELKPLFWLAETEEPSYHEVFDASYTWEFLHKMEAYWRRETGIEGLDNVLHKYNTVFPSTAIRMYFTSNHDENSHSGSEYERMGKAAKTFAVLTATWNGIPLIYSGQELPNYQRLAFFEKDPIPWTGSYQLHDFYKKLLHLHSHHPALRAGDELVHTYRLRTNNDESVFAFLRKCREKEVLVMLNLSAEKHIVTLDDEKINGLFRNIFMGDAIDFFPGWVTILGPWDFLVCEK